jgi:hypothetical protein
VITESCVNWLQSDGPRTLEDVQYSQESFECLIGDLFFVLDVGLAELVVIVVTANITSKDGETYIAHVDKFWHSVNTERARSGGESQKRYPKREAGTDALEKLV